MAVTPYKTLGELRSQLLTRLGFAAAGASAGVIQSNLNSIIQQAQVVLYWTHDWARLRTYWPITIGLNQYLVDYPDDCNPERIKAISILRSSVWSPPIQRGIKPEMYTTQDNTAPPYRWEPYEQIEFFPKADQVYSARVFGIKSLSAFTDDGHHATIDHDMIFTLALADAKAHYRHPDAPVYVQRAEALTIKLKGKSWGQSVFNPNDYVEEVLARPRVV